MKYFNGFSPIWNNATRECLFIVFYPISWHSYPMYHRIEAFGPFLSFNVFIIFAWDRLDPGGKSNFFLPGKSLNIALLLVMQLLVDNSKSSEIKQ